jgi:uncharacterized protein (TIGR02145 family)
MKKIILGLGIVGTLLFTGCGSGGDSSNNNEDTNFVSETIVHNGLEYKTIQSPITKKTWLDRNLGAKMVCNKSRDEFGTYSEYKNNQEKCFGDYYQWGRLTDGHEKIISETTTTQALSINGLDTKFIKYTSIAGGTTFDWLSNSIDDDGSNRSLQWSYTTASLMCPNGFRVPTFNEIAQETVYYDGIEDISQGKVKTLSTQSAFDNFLKLPISKTRLFNGILSSNETASLWTNSLSSSNALYINYLTTYQPNTYTSSGKSYGMNIRCIKN